MSVAATCRSARASMRICSAVAALLIILEPVSIRQSHAQDISTTLSWHDSDGKLQTLSSYHGKFVVLNFWATWCLPCKHEMPMLADMQKRYRNRGVVFLGASVDDEKSRAQKPSVGKKLKIPFSLLVDATTADMQKLNLGEAIPATAFFDPDGRLIGRVLGEMNKSDLQHRIEWMLGNHKGSEPQAFVDGFEKSKTQTTSVPH